MGLNETGFLVRLTKKGLLVYCTETFIDFTFSVRFIIGDLQEIFYRHQLSQHSVLFSYGIIQVHYLSFCYDYNTFRG